MVKLHEQIIFHRNYYGMAYLSSHYSNIYTNRQLPLTSLCGRSKMGVSKKHVPKRAIPTTRPRGNRVADQEFNFEAEFSLLDVGATSSLLRTGTLRPTVLAFSANAGLEALALDWTDEKSLKEAFETARRYVRNLQPVAYALVAHVSRNDQSLTFHLPTDPDIPRVNEFLALAMFAEDGVARGLLYPIRRTKDQLSLGAPTLSDGQTTDWCPLGDIWRNPFCVGDTVCFEPGERAIDPSSSLWRTIVELTRMRIHEDRDHADEYMSFLDDLRNGIFVVAGRPENDPLHVLLRPRTIYNPLGTLSVEASRLVLTEPSPANDVEKVKAS
jgi:hypothetical protein